MTAKQNKKSNFLPVSHQDMEELGWDYIDIVLITGDAYVDHPSFGTAIIGRILEKNGYRVGLIAMPDSKDPDSINIFGKPRLFFGVSGGAIDSMLAKYTALKRYRSDNPFSPGGKGYKPERAVIIYCNLIKKLYKDVPVVIGGIEASMRRIAHYDFWDDKVRRSIIEDSRADILAYGMGEKQIVEIARRLSTSEDLKNIPGTVVMSKEFPKNSLMLPPEEKTINNKNVFIELYKSFYLNQHKILAQQSGKRYLIQYPATDIHSKELDSIYELPYARQPHPTYKNEIPAFEMIKNSITSHRGCFSGCSFCSLSLHQGKRIVSRNKDSIFKEIEVLTQNKNFKGHITDIGGPSANMYGFQCSKQWRCNRESCTFPSICINLKSGTGKWIELLKKASKIKGIRKVSIGSGIRYDLFMKDQNSRKYLKELIKSHISGQLKIAPENTSQRVLGAMRKTPLLKLDDFTKLFKELTKKIGKKQYLIPYLMTCHPGSLHKDMLKTKEDIISMFGFIPDQIQMFIPLPMTLSSVIFYTGTDPLTGEKFPVIRDPQERRKQHKDLSEMKNIKNRTRLITKFISE